MMTRVATMNETQRGLKLFMQNSRHLQYELDTLIENLNKYSEALRNKDCRTRLESSNSGGQGNSRKRISETALVKPQ